MNLHREVCRLCLSRLTNSEYASLEDSTTRLQLETVFSYAFILHAVLPSAVCSGCLAKINDIQLFLDAVRKNQDRLFAKYDIVPKGTETTEQIAETYTVKTEPQEPAAANEDKQPNFDSDKGLEMCAIEIKSQSGYAQNDQQQYDICHKTCESESLLKHHKLLDHRQVMCEHCSTLFPSVVLYQEHVALIQEKLQWPQTSGLSDPPVHSEARSESDSDSDYPLDEEATTEAAFTDQLPGKSKPLYESAYKKFDDWRTTNQIQCIDEQCMLVYFTQELGSLKPSTKWSQYSMLKTTINMKMGIDISGFVNLSMLLKQSSNGYSPKKSKTFTKEQFFRFLRDADDNFYLAMKVVLIVGVYGALRREEILKLTMKNIKDRQNSVKITIPDGKKKKFKILRKFVIAKGNAPDVDMLQLFRSYAQMRPAGLKNPRFFLGFRNGRCMSQAMGINTIAAIPRKIAEFLKLPSAHEYTGHCFHRSSESILAHIREDVSEDCEETFDSTAKSISNDSFESDDPPGSCVPSGVETPQQTVAPYMVKIEPDEPIVRNNMQMQPSINKNSDIEFCAIKLEPASSSDRGDEQSTTQRYDTCNRTLDVYSSIKEELD